MLHLPALRFGQFYQSLETVALVHHRTREPVAQVSQVSAGMIARDARRLADARKRMAAVPVETLLEICRKAGELFMTADLPVGAARQTHDNYVRSLSATTGMPVALCRRNAEKLHGVLSNLGAILGGLTGGRDLTATLDPPGAVLDAAQGTQWFEFPLQTDSLGCVLPSNSPGVHGLWLPAVPLKVPLVIKPGREEPWTPLRLAQALLAAGAPPEGFCFYPTDHAGAAEILRVCGRSMLFGDASTTQPWANDRRVELHGPGFSKVVLGPDAARDWPRYVEVIASSIAENGGRSCLNASAVWTPACARELAEAVATELADIEALPAEDERSRLAAFAHPATAEHLDAAIESGLAVPGAEDVTARVRAARGGSERRLVHMGQAAYLLPTLIRCDRTDHPLAGRELLFPYAAVVECPEEEIFARIGPTLVCTVITQDERFARAAADARAVDRLNLGPIPTWRIRWDQPHEGNLFEHVYRRRAFQTQSA